ncbi:MAG: hypothetical protein ACYDCN_03415 [Bacteroidia bacterium]
MAKVKLGFKKLSVPHKIETARTIVTDTTGNTDFPLTQSKLPPITTAVNALELAYTAAAGGDHSKVSDMNRKARALDALMSNLISQIDTESDGDETKILSTGCNVRGASKPGKRKVGVVAGKNSGEGVCTGTKLKGAFYRWQYCPDPTPDEAVINLPDPVTGRLPAHNSWMDGDPTHEITTTIPNLPTGKKMWFRYAPVLSKKKGGQQAWIVLGSITIP